MAKGMFTAMEMNCTDVLVWSHLRECSKQTNLTALINMLVQFRQFHLQCADLREQTNWRPISFHFRFIFGDV